MEVKTKRKTSISDELAFIFQSGYFGRSEYVIPKETQLTIEEADAAFGNSDGFAGEDYYTRLGVLPCFREMEEEAVRDILSERRFHIPCGKADLPLVALEAVYELRQKYGIRKFLFLTPDAVEREQLCHTVSVMQHHFSDKYYGIKLNIMVYNSDDPTMLRTFALSDDIQLLIVNKEYFIRSNNRMKRPYARLDGLTPLSMIRPARCVALTVSENLREVRSVLRHVSLFDPLCTLSLTKTEEPISDTPATLVTEVAESSRTEDPADETENFQITI